MSTDSNVFSSGLSLFILSGFGSVVVEVEVFKKCTLFLCSKVGICKVSVVLPVEVPASVCCKVDFWVGISSSDTVVAMLVVLLGCE